MFFLHVFTGIELVSETTEEEMTRAEGPAPDLVAGVQLAYTKPAEQVRLIHVVAVLPEISLSHLLASATVFNEIWWGRVGDF